MADLLLVCPSCAHTAYSIAAEQFRSLAEKIADVRVETVSDWEFQGFDGRNTVVLGGDAVNAVSMELYLSGKVESFHIRCGSEDYSIQTQHLDGTDVLLLAGGRPRAILYAVYRYFERCCGCRWFWDGDRLPQGPLPMEGIFCKESPRFEYRGIRYFAHRSLHRFQCEHWSFEDWKTEIDWLLKKRLNLFMLRIGMDDLYQKAFPDIVSYPSLSEKLPEAGEGFDDRSLFWPLQYRGELRRRILHYAFSCDLMHPEDCGTMTHWYSRTPIEFLQKVRPKLLVGQITNEYSEETGLVWDIRENENIQNYFKLTDTHIREYGNGQLFHTIGLAERNFSSDRKENLRLKIYTYHRIAEYLKEHYPNSPLLLASWDLWMYYEPQEVQQLLKELDPSQVILFDYTSDTSGSHNFTNWGVQHRFPWIYGLFGAYEPNNEIRGNYTRINQRTKLAKSDEMCRGFILWPELSHGDNFCIEYMAYHAWNSDTPSIAERMEAYCADRYPEAAVPVMRSVWTKFLPVVEMRAWSAYDSEQELGTDLFFNLCTKVKYHETAFGVYSAELPKGIANRQNAVMILAALAEMEPQMNSDSMLRRDAFDISRTVLGRYINFGIMKAGILFQQKRAEDIREIASQTVSLLSLLAEVLALHEDYSMYKSLLRLERVTQTNPNFEKTLKSNGDNEYCRSYIFEFVKYLYVPEAEIFFSEVLKAAQAGTEIRYDAMKRAAEQNRARFHNTPLCEMDPHDRQAWENILSQAAETICAMAL